MNLDFRPARPALRDRLGVHRGVRTPWKMRFTRGKEDTPGFSRTPRTDCVEGIFKSAKKHVPAGRIPFEQASVQLVSVGGAARARVRSGRAMQRRRERWTGQVGPSRHGWTRPGRVTFSSGYTAWKRRVRSRLHSRVLHSRLSPRESTRVRRGEPSGEPSGATILRTAGTRVRIRLDLSARREQRAELL